MDATDCDDELVCVAGVCASSALCGDGQAEAPEQCDDGNAVTGDGCDNDCTYTEIIAVDAGGAHTCALIEGGRVRCWGLNSYGQLGLGNVVTVGDDESPSDVPDVALPGPVAQISTGLAEHTCARLENQSVYCWGRNNAGQLGLGHTDGIGDNEVNFEPTLVGVDVVDIEIGSFQTCARGVDQTVFCWGLGYFGQLGYGNLEFIGDDELPSDAGSVPIGGQIKDIAVGGSHACGLSLIGTVYCWGYNEFGELGYGHTDNIGDDETPASVGPAFVLPKGVAGGTNAIQLSAGVYHACALFEGGEALCWGEAAYGQLGQADAEHLGDDELPSDALPIDLPAPITYLTAGGFHVCALLESGEAYCWGSSEFGQLGYGNTNNIGDDEPPNAGGPLDVGAGIRVLDAGFFHTCVVNELNELRCWGNNDAGQLGQGNTNTLGDNEALTDIPPVSLF
ncbi:Molybdopterin oxidoreductase, iron-sulfur binding subunit [Enhygromyxa salina]|uniref:Molybdopterin oxidoreductase, iron-sulfur binding subunit n=2 Tax=Enhygromyxa salina TaxID=215803 RepID=A0A0C2CT77_9BACT|nr:Molybdopterin oxidoreductase, iron-sulfur binding subunit [Enhygromyxa salina]